MSPVPPVAAGASKAIVAVAAGNRAETEELDAQAAQFAAKITGAGTKELGAWFGDHIRVRRLKSQLRILDQARKLAEDAGYEPQVINLKVLVPLLETGSLEDETDDEMIGCWAALLANAASGERDVPPSFASVLRDIEPEQARILDHVYQIMMQMSPQLRKADLGILRAGLVAELGLSDETIDYHLDNLIRLRLVRRPIGTISDDPDVVTLSEFGRAFVRACRPPSQPDPPVRFTDHAQVIEQASKNRQRWDQMRATPGEDPDNES
jgi:Abortive infection alpha